ncbi:MULTISPECIES: hypothetical protein [Paenibacillus]|uniref:hypothetical protein n=1 Tax=Paenibacillus TaxID=44249 RepID=UPI00096F1F94|nr:hypothetical protein [Paenibacillus odorifer]OME13957.1 hypothetical protein BSK60_13970 [Paenibacillus odorifer]
MSIPNIPIETVSRILERNLSKIEKMESNVKIGRMISAVTILPMIIALLSLAAYSTYNVSGITYTPWLFVFLLIPLLCFVFFLHKRNRKMTMVSLAIFVILFFFTSAVNAIRVFDLIFPFDIKTVDPSLPGFLCLFIGLCVITCILLWIIVQFTVEEIQSRYFKNVILEIQLIGESPQLFKLINITHRGDYIVNSIGNKNYNTKESLLNRKNIMKITYIAEKENKDE